MLGFTNSITIEKPLSEVFAFVSDQQNNPKWNYFILHVMKTNDVVGKGAEYLQIRHSDKQRIRIVEYKTCEHCVIEVLFRDWLVIRRELIFEGNESQTTVYDRIDLKLPFPRFVSKVFVSTPKRAVKENLEKLKQLLEAGVVVLQNEREVLYN